MVVSSKNIDRDKMAVELYFSVLRIKKAEGLSHKEARALAHDAVELRYNISSKRLHNIISENHESHTCDRTSFLCETRDLISTLKEANADTQQFLDSNRELIEELKNMKKLVDSNNQLIKILEEVCNV
jgi:hypothetical protein